MLDIRIIDRPECNHQNINHYIKRHMYVREESRRRKQECGTITEQTNMNDEINKLDYNASAFT